MVPKVTDRDEVAVPKVLKTIIKITSAERHKSNLPLFNLDTLGTQFFCKMTHGERYPPEQKA